MPFRTILLLLATGVLALSVACGDDGDSDDSSTAQPTAATSPNSANLPQGSDPVDLDPANFVAEIDHPYWPMRPGSRWVYAETDADGTEMSVEVTVTTDTKVIQGINATVVHDIVTAGGEVIENTFDWYAQDVDGNIWYLGEDTEEYENGEVVSTAGSWEHGVDGAMAGIAIPANPVVGMAYRQEYYAGEAEDRARVLSVSEHIEVPFGAYDDALQTEDTTPLQPDVLEHKYYAPGVGPILAIDIAGGGREELVDFESQARN